MTFRPLLAALTILPLLQLPAGQANGPTDGTFRAGLDGVLATLPTNAPAGIPGAEGWLFFPPELRHLAAALTNGPGTNPVAPGTPLAAIVDFNAQLKRAGISLLVVPVPAKAAIYPEKLVPGTVPSEAWGVLGGDSDFCRVLESNGVATLDLAPLFRANRDKGAPLYCATDSHWSPEGIRIAAGGMASRVTNAPWFASVPKREIRTEDRSLSFVGDLQAGTNGTPEAVTLHCASEGGHPPAPWRESPLLLLGDSHDLVFHSGGEMHAVGSGLPDQLASLIGFPPDLVAVMGSGATPARRTLARRRDNLAGKKLVIWCFSARDLTEAPSWDKVQVIR